MNKLLIKGAFRTLFKSKVFVILLGILILLSSSTYTLFQSTGQSFQKSYDNVVKTGALHDIVIKENFKLDAKDRPVLKIKGPQQIYDLNATNLKDYSLQVVGQTNAFRVTLVTSQSYQNFGYSTAPSISLSFTLNGSDWDGALNSLDAAISQFSAELEFQLNRKLMDQFTQAAETLYYEEVRFNAHKSIAVEPLNKAFKVVSYNQKTQVNKMVIYDGTSRFSTPLTEAEMMAELEYQIGTLGHSTTNYTFNLLKGYRIFAEDRVGQTVSVTDASAYQAIVSPAYANQNNKLSLSIFEFLEMAKQPDFYIKLSRDSAFQKQYERNLVWVDSTPYFIVGIGMTPDFAYPIISPNHPTTDVKNQAVVYVNPRGYERIIDGFRTNPQENYISARFQPGVSSSRKSAIMDELEALITRGVLPPGKVYNDVIPQASINGIKMVTTYNDASDQYLLTASRTVFLDKLQSTIRTLAFITTSFLALFVALIVAMIFKVIVTLNRQTLATLLALGYKRWVISASTALTSFLLGVVPSIIGYLAGFLAQYFFIDQFNDFWTIPTYGESFSWISLVITVALPVGCLFSLILLVTYFTLRKPVPDMLKQEAPLEARFVARLIRPFKIMGIKSKYALALTFRNAGRLFVISLTTIAAAVAICVGLSTLGRANMAYKETVSVANYEYKVDLYSPTLEGGQYEPIRFDSLPGLPRTETYDPNLPSVLDKPHWHVPGLNDERFASSTSVLASSQNDTYRNLVASYLKNKLQHRILLDNKKLPLNPWTIAEQLIPDNQLNLINKDWDYVEQFNPSLQGWNKLYDYLLNAPRRPLVISYNTPLIDEMDETYTYVDIKFKTKDHKDFNFNTRITGIRDRSTMYNFDSSKLENYQALQNGSYVYPLFINKYVAKKHNLKIGSLLEGTINNHAGRNLKSANSNAKTTFQVIDIVNGYNDEGFFTAQRHANDALGMTSQGFNGIMSSNKDAAILNGISLYSPSGLYLAGDSVSGVWEQVLANILGDSKIWKYQTEIASDVASFVATYSKSLLVPLINKVQWSAMNQYTFASISKLSAVLINAIQVVTITMSVIFTFLVTLLMIKANHARLVTLWALGYRRHEVIKMVLAKFLVPLLFAMIVAIPIAYGILQLLSTFIMQFGNILIPFSLAFYAPLIVLGIFILVFSVSVTIAVLARSNNRSIMRLKEAHV